MVAFYEEYSSEGFAATMEKYLPGEFVQPQVALLESSSPSFVQPLVAQMPRIVTMTTLSNHYQILFRCKTHEERLFYILYANREHLSKRELERCIANNTFSTIVGSKQSISKGLMETYPHAPVMLKDTLFVDFLDLPPKHSESRLKRGILQHMKQFILCPEADSAVVEYAMSRSMSPAMVAQYKRILIPQERMQQRLAEYCSMIEGTHAAKKGGKP